MLPDIRAGFWSPLMARPTEITASYIGSFLVKCQKVEIWYHSWWVPFNFSRRKKRKTMSSQEGTNQSMAVLPIQLVSFLLLSFPFLSFFKVLSDNFMPGYDAGLTLQVWADSPIKRSLNKSFWSWVMVTTLLIFYMDSINNVTYYSWNKLFKEDHLLLPWYDL